MLRRKLGLIAALAMMKNIAVAQDKENFIPDYVTIPKDELSFVNRVRRFWWHTKKLPATIPRDIMDFPELFDSELRLQYDETAEQVDPRILTLQLAQERKNDPNYDPSRDIFFDFDLETGDDFAGDVAMDSLPGTGALMQSRHPFYDLASLLKWELNIHGDKSKEAEEAEELPPALREERREEELEEKKATRYNTEQKELGRAYEARPGYKIKLHEGEPQATAFFRLRRFKFIDVNWTELKFEQVYRGEHLFGNVTLTQVFNPDWFGVGKLRLPMNGDKTRSVSLEVHRQASHKSHYMAGVDYGRFPEVKENNGANDRYRTEARLRVGVVRRWGLPSGEDDFKRWWTKVSSNLSYKTRRK